MTDERIRVVERGYDALADRFLEWSQAVEDDPRPRLVERFMEAMPDGAAVIGTNNLASWHNIISLLFGWQPPPSHVSDQIIVGNPVNPQNGWDHEDLGRTHLRLFTTRALRELAAYHRLETVSWRTVGFYPLPPRLGSLVAKLDRQHGAFSLVVLKRTS